MRCRCWAGGCPWMPGNMKSTPTRSSARQRTRSSRRPCRTRARRGKLCVACSPSSFVDDDRRSSLHEACWRSRSPRLPSWQILSSRPIAAREGGHLSAHDRGDMISGCHRTCCEVCCGRGWRACMHHCVHVLMQLALYASVRGLSWHTHNQDNEDTCANFCMRGAGGASVLTGCNSS